VNSRAGAATTITTSGRAEGNRDRHKDSSGDGGTAARILDVAERLVQDRGFNAFSYADIAAELQLTTPALHYHYANKANLGAALIARYTGRFAAALVALDADAASAPVKLDGYAGLYLDVLRNQRMCLCGMLAAEYQTLPEPMRTAVLDFFDHNEAWLTQVLEQGSTDGSLHYSGSARDNARMIIGCLEGAMLLARSYADITRFQTTATHVLASIATPPSKHPAR
jgi:TetR/AcrR family transcriptional regulator, transcriptional repressor for nem operon